jgi:hypothetical protein
VLLQSDFTRRLWGRHNVDQALGSGALRVSKPEDDAGQELLDRGVQRMRGEAPRTIMDVLSSDLVGVQWEAHRQRQEDHHGRGTTT